MVCEFDGSLCIKHVVGYLFPSSSLSFTLDVMVVILMISSVQDRVRPVSGRVERSSRQLRVHGTSPDGAVGGRPIWKVPCYAGDYSVRT